MSKKAVSLPLLGLMLASPVFAADPNSFYVVPNLQYRVFDNDLSLENSVAYGLGLGYRFSDRFSAELGYNETKSEPDLLSNSDIDVKIKDYQLDAYYDLGKRGQWQPYVLAGLGEQSVQVDDGDKMKENLLDVGLGARYALAENTDLRMEVRENISLDNENNDAGLGLGVEYHFGGKPAPKAAPAPKPAPAPAPVVKAPVDTDKDGVLDENDKCPDTKAGAKVDAVGCYITLTETKSFRLDVRFANASADLSPEYLNDVRNLAKFLTEYPTTNVVIEGHTDSVGSDAYNQALSDKRAKAVADNLINSQKIEASRVSSKGYGEAKPVATNATAEGRAQNRRVVAVVSATKTTTVTK